MSSCVTSSSLETTCRNILCIRVLSQPSLLLGFLFFLSYSFIVCVIDDSACCNPLYLVGKDVLAKAKTGTGKTVAFLVKHYVFSIREYLFMYE